MQWTNPVIVSIVGAILFVLGILSAGHALLHKREPYSAVVWVFVSLSIPLLGPILYAILGVNRIHRHALKLMRKSAKYHGPSGISTLDGHEPPSGVDSPEMGNTVRIPDSPAEYDEYDPQSAMEVPDSMLPARARILAGIGHGVTGRPLLARNNVLPLFNGEEAFPAMLDAVEKAKEQVWLSTYIFDYDEVGKSFIAAMIRAAARGVDVRLIIDGVGTFFTWPRIARKLRKTGVKLARFIPPRVLPPEFSINLRNHRKLLVVDGRIAFTGGMNITAAHLVNKPPRTGLGGFLDKFRCTTAQDLHFRITGPILDDFQFIFARDWLFTGKEQPDYRPGRWKAGGDCLCRAILDGPDDDFERFHSTLLGVVSSAKSSVHIITPYFLPQRELITAIQSAVLRGVEVSVILPEESDQNIVKWASQNILWEFAGKGTKVYYQPPPFAHTKLLVVDGYYVHMGSANLDPRSMRLNFELTAEVFSLRLAMGLDAYFESIRQKSREYTVRDLRSRTLPVRIRDAFFWMFSPYL